jgi:hypothetical protein
MRIRFTMLALLLATLPSRGFAQSEPISTVRMSLAVGRLPSVIDMPLFFRLYRVSLPECSSRPACCSAVLIATKHMLGRAPSKPNAGAVCC